MSDLRAEAQDAPPSSLAARELAALIDILRDLNAAFDPTERLPQVVQRAARALTAEAGSLFLLEGDPPLLVARVLHQPAAGEVKALSAPLVIAPGEGTAGWVALHNGRLNLPDVTQDERFKPYHHPGALEIRSLLSVPLKADGRVLGVIDLVNRPGGFDLDAESFLAAVADELAIALRNHILVRSLEKEKLALEVMREVSHTLLSTLEVAEVLKRIVVGLGRLIAFDAVGIFLVREDGTIEHAIERGYESDRLGNLRQKVGEGLIGWSISTADPAIVPDVRVDGRYIAARDTTQSEMVAPLISRGKVIGAFNLESDKLAAYTRDDLKRLSAFADSAAVALEVARLHEESVRSRRLEEDLAIARQIQLSFLPQARPRHKGI
ncbi:MAG TPA: GAF domain-containing protein, partial [Candidatus Udaeobacter sp.]|nr:GAF domain-containing protein [Candidatus Udaeobacter sp.]